MPANVPHRLTAQFAHLRMNAIADPRTTSNTYTPTADFATLPIFGPVRDLDIDDPMEEVNQTAGGDVGAHIIHGRKGTWNIRFSSFQDAAGVFGESRLGLLDAAGAPVLAYNTANPGRGTLIGMYVEFLVLNEIGYNVCKGIGRFNGRLVMNAAQNETIVRDGTIARWHGGNLGNLVWADLATGAFIFNG